MGKKGEDNVSEAHGLVLKGRDWSHGDDATVGGETPGQIEKKRNSLLSCFFSPSHWPNPSGNR